MVSANLARMVTLSKVETVYLNVGLTASRPSRPSSSFRPSFTRTKISVLILYALQIHRFYRTESPGESLCDFLQYAESGYARQPLLLHQPALNPLGP
jgi:hypothetical protein